MKWILFVLLGLITISHSSMADEVLEKATYSACFEPIGIKISSSENKKIEAIRSEWIELLADRKNEIIGWLPNMSFAGQADLAAGFVSSKGKDPVVLQKLADKYGQLLPDTMKWNSYYLSQMIKGLKLCDKVSEKSVRAEIDKTIQELTVNIALNNRIEKKLSDQVKSDLAEKLGSGFKFEKPGSATPAIERAGWFITGFISQKIAQLRADEQKNSGQELLPRQKLSHPGEVSDH
jgi:hypothetical protein